MIGNLKRLRKTTAPSRLSTAKCTWVGETTNCRSVHVLTLLRPQAIQELVRVIEVSSTEITGSEDRTYCDGGRREE